MEQVVFRVTWAKRIATLLVRLAVFLYGVALLAAIMSLWQPQKWWQYMVDYRYIGTVIGILVLCGLLDWWRYRGLLLVATDGVLIYQHGNKATMTLNIRTHRVRLRVPEQQGGKRWFGNAAVLDYKRNGHVQQIDVTWLTNQQRNRLFDIVLDRQAAAMAARLALPIDVAVDKGLLRHGFRYMQWAVVNGLLTFMILATILLSTVAQVTLLSAGGMLVLLSVVLIQRYVQQRGMLQVLPSVMRVQRDVLVVDGRQFWWKDIVSVYIEHWPMQRNVRYMTIRCADQIHRFLIGIGSVSAFELLEVHGLRRAMFYEDWVHLIYHACQQHQIAFNPADKG